MLTNIIACISAKQATVGLWRMGRFVSCNVYTNDDAGHAKFRLFLTSHRESPIQLIIDAVEEDYRTETMPHSSGRARNEMLKRKLSQIYRNTTYRTAQFIGRETDKRRDDRILLMALTNADLVTPWVTIIEEIEAPLAGAYMLPTISQLLIKLLKLKQPNLLLMTRQSAGLRQTYFANQQARLSRINPVTGLNEQQIANLCLSETEKTRLYLVSLRVITRETPIHLVFPSTSSVTSDLAAQLEEQQGISADVIPVEKLAKQIGLSADVLTRYPDLLHMHVLARGRVSNNLLPEAQLKHYRLLLLKWGLNAASAATVGIAGLVAISSLLNTASLKQQIDTAIQQTKAKEIEYIGVSRNFPKTPISGGDLKIAVDLAQKFDDLNKTPRRFMSVVSESLEKQPELLINRLRWKQTEDARFNDELPGKAQAKAATGQFIPVPPPPPSGLYEIGFIDGEIRNFSGDYRAALESVELLATNLKQNKEVAQVNITQQPFNTSSKTSLQGSTLDQQSQQTEKALFQLKIFLKPETPPPPAAKPPQTTQQVKP
jgi:hypothetical protein